MEALSEDQLKGGELKPACAVGVITSFFFFFLFFFGLSEKQPLLGLPLSLRSASGSHSLPLPLPTRSPAARMQTYLSAQKYWDALAYSPEVVCQFHSHNSEG